MRRPRWLRKRGTRFAMGGTIPALPAGRDPDAIPAVLGAGCGYFLPAVEPHLNVEQLARAAYEEYRRHDPQATDASLLSRETQLAWEAAVRRLLNELGIHVGGAA